jgi:hypothetical protein
MFANLTERLSKAANALRGRGRLTEDNIASRRSSRPYAPRRWGRR